MSFIIEYDFQPNDSVWIVNTELQSVNRGTCLQVDIKIHDEELIIYWVLLDNENGSIRVLPENIFATVDEAVEALELYLNS